MKHKTLEIVTSASMVGLLLGLSLAACGDSRGVTTPGPVAAYSASGLGNGPGAVATGGPVAVAPPSPDILTALGRAIQDEYHAEHTYLGVLADFGEVAPFSNIVHAEQRHVEAAAGLFLSRSLAVPESEWNLGNVTRFRSVQEACAGAAQAEEDNIAMYDEFLKLDLPQDVRNVFTNNRRASLENHLPAFERCR